MTKKRFKLSMAALGLLAAFLLALTALLLAPTLASANKDSRMLHHGAKPGTGYPHGGPGAHGFAANWNESGHDHGNVLDAPFCVNGGVYPCTVAGDTDDGFGGAGGYSSSYENGYGGGGNSQGGGSSNNNGRYSPNFWNGGGGAGGGAGGGGQGGNPGGNKAGSDESNKPDSEKNGDKTGGPGPELLTWTPPDDDQPSPFVDPSFGGDPTGGPKTEGGPNGENPITEIAVTEVPEPLTLSLFAVGLAGAGALRRRSKA